MGIPGSGKGTQGKLFAEARGYIVISTGEILRKYGTPEQHARMQTGEILGDEEVTKLVDKSLSKSQDPNRIILDGYPRRVAQAQWLVDQSREGRFDLDCVVLLEASPQAVVDRLKARGRKDDNEESIKARFEEYEAETLPILEFLRGEGVKVVEVNAEQAIDQVHNELLELVVKKEL
jgi:adenylate kinase